MECRTQRAFRRCSDAHRELSDNRLTLTEGFQTMGRRTEKDFRRWSDAHTELSDDTSTHTEDLSDNGATHYGWLQAEALEIL